MKICITIIKNSLPVLLLLLHVQAGAETFPRIQPSVRAIEFFNRGSPGRTYTWTDLAEISLWASAEDTRTSHYEQIMAMAQSIRSSPQLPAAGRDRAEFILDYMHRNLLRSYSVNQTRVDTMLENGRFNCVSSAVLYMILCRSVGLEVNGVVTRDHAFTTVHIDGETIDVETTNSYGFDPGNRREFHDQFGRLTGFNYVPARNYRDRQSISPLELVSLILHNRIAEHESRNRFADAIPLAVDRAALLMGGSTGAQGAANTSAALFEDPRQDLMNRLFNYGTFLLRMGREEDCLRWAAHAEPVYPNEVRWQEFIHAAANNRLQKFVRANQLTEARNFLENQSTALSRANYTQLDSLLYDTELLGSANRIGSVQEGDNVIAAIDQARRNNRISERRAQELLTFAIQKTASLLTAAPARDWLAAIDYVENAIGRFGPNRELEQALRTYRNNRAADFHNRFAAAWNRRDFDEAERILNEGLAEFPNDRQLLSNRETINRSRR